MTHPGHPASHRRHPMRRPPDHTCASLRALLRAGLITDLRSIIRAADEIDPTQEAGKYLRSLNDTTDTAHALRLLETHVEVEAIARYEQALSDASSGRVAIIPPVPPHLFEDFGWGKEAVALMVDHHDLPPSIRHSGRLAVCSNPLEALAYIEVADVVLFDAYRDVGGFWIRRAVRPLLDERHLRPSTRLLVHVRPHPDHLDETAPAAISARITVI